jgi:SAM-dependent methyltransferase
MPEKLLPEHVNLSHPGKRVSSGQLPAAQSPLDKHSVEQRSNSHLVRDPGGIADWLDRRFYPEFVDNWDDKLFRNEILSHIGRDTELLDLGAGAGILEDMNFRGLVNHVAGIDPDPRVCENPYLDSAHVGYGELLPYGDQSFDVVFADNVLEHLANPLAVFMEVQRVLRPGGVFMVKTPNRWHYVPVIASLTPHWFHQLINRWRGRKSDDTFPTLYKANTIGQIKRLATNAGLAVLNIRAFEGRPEYLRRMWPLCLIGIVYERLVNRFRFLSACRVVLIATLRRGL